MPQTGGGDDRGGDGAVTPPPTAATCELCDPGSPRRPGSTFWVRQGLLGWGQRRGEGGQGLRSG